MGRVHATAAAVLVWAAPALADERVLDLRFETVELVRHDPVKLVHTVEDLAGAVRQLAITETETEIRIELSGDVLFDFDRADIKPEAEPMLAEVAELLKQHPGQSVLIEGHTDSIGSADYNLRLSRQRAESVKDWLVNTGGVDGRRLQTRGFGMANPVAPNTHPDGSDNPEGRQQNRRVEIKMQKR